MTSSESNLPYNFPWNPTPYYNTSNHKYNPQHTKYQRVRAMEAYVAHSNTLKTVQELSTSHPRLVCVVPISYMNVYSNVVRVVVAHFCTYFIYGCGVSDSRG